MGTIRSMITHVNKLIQAQAVDLAFTVEKVITSSFDVPKSILDTISGLPVGYKEYITAECQKTLFKAFDMGFQHDPKTVESNHVFEALNEEFRTSIEEYTEGLDVAIPVASLAEAFSEGKNMNNPIEKEVETQEVTAANGYPSLQKSDNIDQKDVIKHMEEYISKLDPKAQEVMRYYLGIQYGGGDGGKNNGRTTPIGMKVQASAEGSDEVYEKVVAMEESCNLMPMVGPYPITLLREQTLNVVKASEFDFEDAYVVIEHVVTGTNVYSQDELVEAIADKLEIAGVGTMEELQDKVDDLSADLTIASELPGSYVFAKIDDCYCLVYAFKKSEVTPIVAALEEQAVAANDLKLLAPNGTLSTLIQNEIKNLVGMKTIGGSSLRDLKRVSPGIASYVSKTISNYRNGKCTHQELATLLKADTRDLIEMVFGKDGAGYYDYCKSN